MGPLTSIRVLDLSRLLPGPACSWYLSGMGAQVDRLEPPGSGDPTRSLPPLLDGVGAFFAALNAGNRSIALDLRREGASAAVLRLVRGYDVLIDGFKPCVLEAAGLGPDRLLATHPGLVVARLSGWGQTGAWRDRPGHDLNYQGLAGLVAGAALSGDTPAIPSFQAADLSGALVAAMGICAALFARGRDHQGRVLDVSLSESALSLHHPHVTALTAEGRAAVPGGELLTGALPVYGTYRCQDGKYLTVGALEPKFQRELATTLGVPSRANLEARFREAPRDVWVERLAAACVAPALSASELADHPHWASRRALVRAGRATFVRPPLTPEDWRPGPVAAVGEHTQEILHDGGFSLDEIAALGRARVIPWS